MKKTILICCLFASMFMTACVSTVGKKGAPLRQLKVSEGFENPLGFYDAEPTFSWKLAADSLIETQKAYRIVVSSKANNPYKHADIWDSGVVQSDDSTFIKYQGKPLSSRQKVYWQVKVWSQDDKETAWSEVQFFELGLLHNEDWTAKWMHINESAGEETIELSWDNLVITKAVYGLKEDFSSAVDVLAAIHSHQKNKKEYFQVSRSLWKGKDPFRGKVKYLELTGIRGGEKFRHVIKDRIFYDLVSGKSSAEIHKPEYFRKEFMLKDKFKSARLYITSKGTYRAYINGEQIGDDYLTPGWTETKAFIETRTYDVGSKLREGDNALAVILAEGWYAGFATTGDNPNTRPSVLLQLEIEYQDGRRERIQSDSTWKACNEGPIRSSEIWHGEFYDQNYEMPGWNTTAFDDSDWAPVTLAGIKETPLLQPKCHNPTRFIEVLDTIKLTEPEPGRFVFDMGQNMVGVPILEIPVIKDQTVLVRFGEMLNKDGSLYTANYRRARSQDHYTAARTGTITWSPSFTFHGYRYVELSGFAEGTKAKKEWVRSSVLHSDFKQRGSFSSSDKTLNQLQSNILWGIRGNFLDIPTDCPQRDERFGWTGDAQVICATTMSNFDVLSFWKSWFKSMRAAQMTNGLIPHAIPESPMGEGSPGWGDVCVTSPWDVYVRSGDIEVLKNNYDMMKKWVAAYEREATDYIVSRKGHGDWLQPNTKRRTQRGDAAMDLIATAYFGRCTKILTSIAGILKNTEDKEKYEKQFKGIQRAFSKRFFDNHGKLTTKHKVQTEYLMALGYDLLQPELVAGALENLLIELEEAGGNLRTGFLGTPLINSVLDKHGHINKAYSVLFRDSYPGWFYSIRQGATTMWERWNSYSHKDGFESPGMNSFNHYAYGAIGQWMQERIAGLAPDPENPGYKHFFIQPNPAHPLTDAAYELDTPYGIASSGWKKSGDDLIVNATVPPNTTATFIAPQTGKEVPKIDCGKTACGMSKQGNRYQCKVGPGEYIFTVIDFYKSDS